MRRRPASHARRGQPAHHRRRCALGRDRGFDALGVESEAPGLPAEVTYRITRRAPTSISADDLRRYRQIVVIGDPGERIASELYKAPPGISEGVRALAQYPDLWRRGQRVTSVALPEQGEDAAALHQIEHLAALLDRDYTEVTRQRVWANGEETQLTAALARAGIALRVPHAYRRVPSPDSIHWFGTYGNDQSPLIRSFLITSRPLDTDPLTPEHILEWRRSVAELYGEGQEMPREFSRLQSLEAGPTGFELSGVWQGRMYGQMNAGPFISRVIDCPDQGRRYLLDAWALAPEQTKYRYIIQLTEILDTFACSAAESGGAGDRA